MDYTTLAIVRQEIGNVTGTADDGLINRVITAASRFMDRYLTAAPQGCDNYLLSESLTETHRANAGPEGRLVVFPHKPAVASVASLSYRVSPAVGYQAIDSASIEIDGRAVYGWDVPLGSYQVQISYAGGLATDTAGLPADIIEAATVLAARFYREARAGLSDVIGLDEIGTMFYTKAVPERVRLMLQPYRRVVRW